MCKVNSVELLKTYDLPRCGNLYLITRTIRRLGQVHDHKDDLDGLLRDLQQMKRRYFEQKRRDQLQREATARSAEVKDQRERPKETKSAFARRPRA